MIIIRPASEDDIPVISKLAHQIWADTYSDILPADQIAFMLNDMYSSKSLAMQMAEGAVFIMLQDDLNSLGFASYSSTETSALKVHKLYILKTEQGKGLGRRMLDYIENRARELEHAYIELNVNRNNPAFHFYTKSGFRVSEEVDIPYHGYILNDYVLRLPLL